MLSEDQPFYKSRATNLLKVTHLWHEHDRYTIVSRENDQEEERSLRVEESVICEHEFKHNFKELEGTTFRSGHYELRLACEVEVGCIVSLKEVDLSKMNLIAAELSIYTILENEGYKSEARRNILELYQVQISGGSYLLIKEPYLHNIAAKFHQLQAPQQSALLA